MTKVLVIAHHERHEASDLARRAGTWLRARHHDVWVLPEDAKALDLDELAADRPPTEADVVVSLGGDGTTLRAVDLVSAHNVPVLGVNVGLLGYLNEIEPAGLVDALDGFISGRHTIEERMMLEARVQRRDGTFEPPVRALNEAVLERDESGHTVRLAVRIDGALFTTYAADGLIVSTPTGSTAYSLSARGPIVSPAHKALLLTPVSPHMLFDRSLVLDPEQDLALEVIGHRRAVLSVDGRRAGLLAEGDALVCAASLVPARFVRFPGARHFHQILKSKFGLADR